MNDEPFGTIDGSQITLYDKPAAPADTRTDEQRDLDAFRLNRALHVDSATSLDTDVRAASAILERDFARRAKLGTVQTDLLLGRGAEKDPRAVLRKMQDFYRSGDPRNLWTDERREAEDAAARGVDALYALASKKAHTAWWRNIGDPLDRAADEAMRRAGRDRPIDADKFEALMGSGDPELDEETAQSLRGAQSILTRRRDLQKAADDAAARRAGSDDYIAAGQALSDFEREHADELAAASALVGKWHGKADKALTAAQYLSGLRAAQPDLMAAAVLSSGVLKSPVSAAILQNARDSRPGRGGVAESLDLSFSASDKAEWLSLPKEDREIITPILQAYVNPRDLGRVPVFGAIYEGFLEAGKSATNIGFQAAHTAEGMLRRTVMDGANVQKWEEDWAELQEMRETATKKSENHWLPTDWAIGAASQAPYMFGASLPYGAGIALITAQAATDYISQVAREGGDVSNMDTVAEALGIGLATGISEKIEVDIFKGARKMTPLERIRVYDCLKASSIIKRFLGDTAGELTQEALQDALMGAAVAAKLDRDWVPAMAQGAWEAIREGYGDFLVLGMSGVGTQIVAQRHGAINGAQAERISEFVAPVIKDILTAKAAGQLAPLPDMEAWKANMGDISDKFRKAGGMRGGGVKFLEDLGFKHDAALSIGYAIESTYRAVLRTGSGKTISDFFGGRGMRTWKDILTDFFGGAEVTPVGENVYTVRRTIRNGSRSVETETRIELGKVATDWSVIEQRDESGAPTAEAQGMAASVVQGLKQQDRASAVTEADILAMTGEELRRFVEAKALANPGWFRLTSGGAAVDSDQLAALTGTIRFDPTLDPEAFLHEAGHAFLAYAEKAGILTDADFAALRAMFGEARTAKERVNEEAFSDALRDAMAGRVRWTDQTLFERIRDAIVRLLDMGAELLHLRRNRQSAADAARDSVFEQVLSGNVRGIPMVAASQDEKASPSGAATATPSEAPPSAPPAPEPNTSENPTGSESPDSSETPARPRRAPTEWTAVTPDGSMRLSGDWVVVDASTLLASSDPGYDQALQPRDRSTLASDSQVHAIATELDPARLADSPTTDTGAPLVSADGMVLSGNGRTLAIRAAYASGLAGAYAEAVRARASEMGLAVPDSMRAPVLVRRLSAETSREDLVRAAELSNRPQILSRNESETAEADAATILSGGFMDLLQPGDNGELLGEANRAFMDAFINATGDQGLRTADGFPTEAAQKRVRRAVLAALFQDLPNRRDLIRAAVEDADELHVTRELAGLMRGAPAILRSAAARPAYDLRQEIGLALADYFDFRRQGGGDINAYLAQGQLFDERPPEVSAVLREIGKRRDAASISDFLQDYARRAEAQAAEGQDTFAFFAPPTKLDLLAAASEATLPEGTSRSPAEYAPPPYRRGTAVLPGPDAKPLAASQVDAQGRPTTKVRMLPPGAWNLLRAPYDVRRAPAPSAQDKTGRGLGISAPPPTGHSDIFPHFQGNKTEMAARTTQAIRRTMSDAERAHYDTIVDYFGGGGCWGLYHALENFPGVRRLVVNEFDPDRLGKIRLLHEHDGKVADTAGAFLLDDVRLGQIREAAQNSSSPTTIASKVQSILLPTVKDANMRAALQAFIDCAHTMLASATDEKGNVVRDSSVGVRKVLDALREDGRKAKAAADEFKARGGTIEYHAGDAATFDDAPRGDRVMAVADPPYYLTADYQQNTILGLDIVPDNWSYRATQGLLHKLAEAGDGIIYTDEAWWFKDSYVPDRQDSLFGGGSTFDKEQDILLDVINTLDHFDVAGRVAGRQEVLGIHHGHAIDQETESGTGGDAARPDAADHSGGGQGARPPVLGMAAEPQGQGGRDGATGGERGPDGAGSGAVAPRLSISGAAGAERLGIRNLADAEAMERSGASHLDIWRETGWWKGEDGEWRIEIGDIRIKDNAFQRLRNRNAKVKPKYNADNLPTPEEIADDPALMDGIELELVAHLAAETTKYDPIHGRTQFVKDEKEPGGIRFLSFDESYDLHLKDWAQKHPELFAVLEESEMLDGPGGVKDSVSRIAAQIKRGDITRGTTKNRARMWWTNYAKKQAVPQTLGELVEGPILDAYPELRNIRIVPWGKSVRNSYAGEAGTNHIAIRMEERGGIKYGPRVVREILAHEIAHQVQRIEGLTQGSSPEMERRNLDRDNTQRARESRTLSAENDLTSTLLRIGLGILERTGKTVDVNAIMAQVERAAATDRPDVGRIVDDIVSGLGENDATQDDAERIYDKVLAFIQAKQQEIHPPSEAELLDDAREAYMAAGGEVEARMVEARLDLTDEQKKEIPPWVTEAVVRQDLFDERSDYSYAAQRSMMARMAADGRLENPLLDTANPDIRYSVTPAEDAAYMDAVRRGDMETAQRMVDRRVRDLGGVFHRGKAPDATQYIVEFADDPTEILQYGEHQYALLPNQLTDVPDFVKDFALEYFAEDNGVSVDEMSDEEKERYRDSVLPAKIRDWADAWDRADFVSALWERFSSEFEEMIENGIVGFKTPDGAVAWPQEKAAYKIADPVTYDDAGNVIPLSQRFNPEREDIRYSIVPINGRDMMVVPSPALTTREAQDESKVKTLLRQTVIGRAFSQLGEPADKLVKVDEDFLDEFWKSNDSEKLRRTREKLWRAKVDAASHLDELLATTPRGDPEPPKHSNNPVKQGGTFYRSQTEFGVYDWRGVSVYPCQLLVFETKDGNRYVWDIIDIKKPTLAAKGALSNEVVAELEMAARGIGTRQTFAQAPGSVNPASRESFTPLGAGLSNESIFAGLLAADYVSGKDRGDETYERLRRALHVEDAGTLAEARAYAREMAEVRRYGLAGRAEASVRDAAAQGGQNADAIFGDAPSPDWTAEDYARHYEQFAAARALADAALGGMQEGVHLGAAARKAIDQARRNLIREAQGIDYEETVRHGGIDIAATLLGIDPDKFGAWGKKTEEKEEEKPEPEPGPGEPGGRPLTEEEAGQVETEQLALDERVKKLLDLFRGWKAERESERRKKERQRAEEERRRAQRAATEPGADKKQSKADEEIDEEDTPDFTLFSVPLRLLKLCNIDVNNATEMAAFLRILVADYLVSRDATLTHETVFKRRPDNVSIYRKTMMRMMDELATKLVDPTKGGLLRNIQKHIERIPERAGVDTIERRTAAILRSIQMGAVRRTQGDLIRELRRDIHALGIRGRTLDKMERDAERKINGEREAMARYVNRIVAMGPRAVAAETDRLREIMDRRMADYSGADGRESAFGDVVRDAPVAPPGVKVESDVVYHDAAEKLRLLQEYGALRFALPAEIVEKGNKLRLWLEKGREEHLAKFEAKAAENRAARDAIRAALASSGRSRRQRKGLLARFLEENGSVCFAQRVQILLADMPEGAAKREASRALTRCMRLIAEGSQERSVLMRRYAREFEGAVAAAIRNRRDADGNEWTVKSYLAHLDEKIPDSLSRYLTKQRNYDDGTRGGDARLTWGQTLNLLGYLEQTATYAENIRRHGREGQAAAIRAAASEADLALLSQLRAVYAARRDALSVPVREISGFSVYNPDPLYMPANMFIPGSERDGLDTRVRGAWNPLAAPLTPRRANSRDVDESVSIADAYNRSSKATADAIAFGVRGIDLRSILASGPVKEAIREAEGPDFARAFNAHLTDILTGGDPGESGGTSMEMLRHVGTMASYSFLAWNPTSVLKQMTSIPAWAPLLPGGFRDVLRYMRDFDVDSFRELCDAPGFVQRYGLDGIGVNRARAILADPTLSWAQKVAQCGMIGLQIGDSIPGFLVGTGLYKAKKQEYANAGESPELAAEHAARDTWALIEECQQSDLVQNLPELMRRHGVLGRSVLKFAASPLQQLSWEIHAWRIWKRTGNRDDLRRAIDATVANHVIMPALLWVVENAMGAALGDDPDDEDSWRLRELLVMSLLGSFGRVFFVGSLTDSGLRRLFGLRTYTNGAMPGTDMAAGLVRHGVGAARYLIEADYDRAVEELVKTVGSVAPPVKMASKAIENWTD